jgi:hypothetical protein
VIQNADPTRLRPVQTWISVAIVCCGNVHFVWERVEGRNNSMSAGNDRSDGSDVTAVSYFDGM